MGYMCRKNHNRECECCRECVKQKSNLKCSNCGEEIFEKYYCIDEKNYCLECLEDLYEKYSD